MGEAKRRVLGLREWFLPCALALIALMVAIAGDTAAEQLRYEREAILQGELWRLLSGHLAHLGWSHLFLNLAGLGLLWVLLGQAFNPLGWLALLLISSFTISFGLLVLNPLLHWYVGLSGLLHTILLAGAVALTAQREREGAVLLLLAVAKLAWEQLVGPLPGSEETAGGTVVVDAHLYGAIAGGVLALVVAMLAPLRRQLMERP